MLNYVTTAKRYLWAFVEAGFVGLLAVMIIYLVLGENAGVFVQSVGANVVKFANDIPPGALVGLASVGALLAWINRRAA